MPLSFFTNQSQNNTLILLVDIGSSSVGVALVSIRKSSAPRILVSVREDIPFAGNLASQSFQYSMNNALGKALKKVHKAGFKFGVPSSIFCTLSSPWFVLKTRNINIKKEEGIDVGEGAVATFIEEDIARLKEELKKTFPPHDISIIEKKIMQLKLNGEEVDTTRHNKKAKHVELLMTVGVSSHKVIQGIEKKIQNLFHTKEVHFGTFPVVAWSAIRDLFSIEKDFLFMDITGEATDVSRVDNDLLMSTVSFPLGRNFFIREISAQLSTVPEEASTLFSMFLRNELGETIQTHIAEIIARAENKWSTRFEETLTKLAQKGPLPGKIFFTVDADIQPLFERLIVGANGGDLMRSKIDVQYLDQLIVSSFVSFEAGVTRDPFIVVEALLVEKLIAQNV